MTQHCDTTQSHITDALVDTAKVAYIDGDWQTIEEIIRNIHASLIEVRNLLDKPDFHKTDWEKESEIYSTVKWCSDEETKASLEKATAIMLDYVLDRAVHSDEEVQNARNLLDEYRDKCY